MRRNWPAKARKEGGNQPREMTGETGPNHRLGGLFVDFENIAIPLMNEYGFPRAEALAKVLRIIGNVQGHLKEMNVEVVSRHAFADWSQYPEVQGELYRMGVRTQNVASTIHKNSADIELSLSVLETLLTRKDIETLLVISGD